MFHSQKKEKRENSNCNVFGVKFAMLFTFISFKGENFHGHMTVAVGVLGLWDASLAQVHQSQVLFFGTKNKKRGICVVKHLCNGQGSRVHSECSWSELEQWVTIVHEDWPEGLNGPQTRHPCCAFGPILPPWLKGFSFKLHMSPPLLPTGPGAQEQYPTLSSVDNVLCRDRD